MITCCKPLVQFALHDRVIFRVCHDPDIIMPCLTVLYSWPRARREAWESGEVFAFSLFQAGCALPEIASGSGFWRENFGLEDMLGDIPAKYHDEIRRNMP